MDNCIKILIADASQSYAAELAGYLKTCSSFEVVGVANDGEKPLNWCAPKSRMC